LRTVQDPDTFRDLLYAVVTGQRNHEDSRRKGLAVAAGKRRAAERGDFLGFRPDGYRLQIELDERGGVKKWIADRPGSAAGDRDDLQDGAAGEKRGGDRARPRPCGVAYEPREIPSRHQRVTP
jgi:hypothetical protein